MDLRQQYLEKYIISKEQYLGYWSKVIQEMSMTPQEQYHSIIIGVTLYWDEAWCVRARKDRNSGAIAVHFVQMPDYWPPRPDVSKVTLELGAA